jgi:hypothetical protein
MRLPKFWPKSGRLNDFVMTISSFAGFIAAFAVATVCGLSAFFGLTVMVCGYFMGFAAGIAVIGTFSTFFGTED